jgi:hypothetical protein
MTNIEAITQLENAFKNNPEYRKKWKDYIEMAITEALEAKHVRPGLIIEVRGSVAEEVFRLFQADWWKAQERR